jgi:Domain of unknown function (DUF3846)
MSSIGDGITPSTCLARCDVNGEVKYIANKYEAIKEALNGGILDFTILSDTLGVYLDDEGVLNRLPLNIVASLHAGTPIYGPVVLCAARPDAEGDSLPPAPRDVEWFKQVGERWNRVVVGIMVRGSGDPHTYGSPDDLAPPIILSYDEDGNVLGD